MNLERLLDQLRAWGLREPAILGIARVGCHPSGKAGAGSVLDVLILLDDPRALASDADWMARFGTVDRVREEDLRPVVAKRVLYADGREVLFRFASPAWAATEPCDLATRTLAESGLRVVYDPKGLLRRLAIAARVDGPERHFLRSTCGRYERQIWFAPGLSDGPHRLAIFLDGEFYLHDMDCLPVLRACMTAGGMPSMTFVFVSFQDSASRHEDYPCNAAFARFLADDVVAWVEQRDPRIAGSNHLLCGVSLSGLAAAYTVARCPDRFSTALCQSGSFWWLADHATSLPPTRAKYWLSVGTEEIETNVRHPPTGMFQRVSQIEGVESAARSLEAMGGTVHCHRYSGGHEFSCWREELAPALHWLVGT